MLSTLKKSKKYFALVFINVKNRISFQAEIIIMIMRNLLIMSIFVQLYSATFRAAQATQFGGLNLQQILWLLIIIRMLDRGYSTVTLVNNEIKSGEITYTINRPYSYILFHYASYWGTALPNIFIDIISNLIPAYFLIGPIHVSSSAFMIFVLVAFLGLTLEFLLQIIIGLAAFWMENTVGLRWILHKSTIILGGLLIPIAMYPDGLQRMIQFLPFASIYYDPALLMVNFNFALFLKIVCVQILWIVILGFVALKIFRQGIKNVSINGG